MLQKMNDRLSGIITAVIIVIICLAFGLWGIQYYLRDRGSADSVAKVNGIKISRQQFQSAYERARQQMIYHLGKHYSPDQKTQQELKKNVLKNLIQTSAFYQEATGIGFKVGDQELNAALTQLPIFQVDGKFSAARFEQVLNGMLYSEDDFLNDLRQEIISNQLQGGIISSDFILPNEVDHFIGLLKQTRDVGYTVLSPARFTNSVKISDADMQNYYQSHKKDFTTPEQVSVSYVELNQKQFVNNVKVNDKMLQQYYQENIDIYSHPQRWEIERIVVPVAANASHSDLAKAQTQINALIKKAKSGESFANLDPAHGKPVWIVKQQMPADFMQNIQQLKVGQISAPFRAQDGLNVVRVAQIAKAQTLSFAKVRDRVKTAYRHEKATELFDQANQELSDATYTNSNSLQEAAKKLNLKIQTTPFFTADGLKIGIAAIQKVIKAAFSDSVLQQGYNSDPIELAPGQIIVLRVNKHNPAVVKPLTAVALAIKHQLIENAANSEAQQLGKKIVQEINGGGSAQKVVEKNGLQWKMLTNVGRKAHDIDAEVLKGAFNLPWPAQSKPTVGGINLDKGFAIVAVYKVHPGKTSELSKKQKIAFAHAMSTAFGMANFNAYAAALVKRAKVEKTDNING